MLLVATVQVMLKFCCFPNPKVTWIKYFICKSSWNILRKDDETLLMFTSRGMRRNVTVVDIRVECKSMVFLMVIGK